MATHLLRERLRFTSLTPVNETQLQEERVLRDLKHLPDLEAGRKEDSAEALLQVVTVQAAQEVLIPKKTRKRLRHGVSLVFVLWMSKLGASPVEIF